MHFFYLVKVSNSDTAPILFSKTLFNVDDTAVFLQLVIIIVEGFVDLSWKNRLFRLANILKLSTTSYRFLSAADDRSFVRVDFCFTV